MLTYFFQLVKVIVDFSWHVMSRIRIGGGFVVSFSSLAYQLFDSGKVTSL